MNSNKQAKSYYYSVRGPISIFAWTYIDIDQCSHWLTWPLLMIGKLNLKSNKLNVIMFLARALPVARHLNVFVE